MSRLKTRELSVWDQLPKAELVDEVTNRFLPISSRVNLDIFNRLNNQFFNNELPACLLLDYGLDSGVGGFFSEAGRIGFITVQKQTDYFQRVLVILHEMQHYYNHIQGIEDTDHGKAWAKSIQHINDKLNIKINTSELNEEELKSYPFGMFEAYCLTKVIRQGLEAFDELTPLPDDWTFERREVSPVNTETKKVICTGNVVTDLISLKSTYGLQYIAQMKGLINV